MKRLLLTFLVSIALLAPITAGALPYGIALHDDLDDLLKEGYELYEWDESSYQIVPPAGYPFPFDEKETYLTVMPAGNGMDWLMLMMTSDDFRDEKEARQKEALMTSNVDMWWDEYHLGPEFQNVIDKIMTPPTDEETEEYADKGNLEPILLRTIAGGMVSGLLEVTEMENIHMWLSRDLFIMSFHTPINAGTVYLSRSALKAMSDGILREVGWPEDQF